MKEYFSSIRFRIWITFVVFSLGTMAVLVGSRAVLTPIFYGKYKTTECINTANKIEELITSGTWNQYDIQDVEYLKGVIKDMATAHQFDIIINMPDTDRNIITLRSGDNEILTQRITKDIKNSLINKDDGTIISNVELNNSDGIIFAKCVKQYFENVCYIPAYIFIFSYTEPIGTTMNIINSISFICANVILLVACVISIMISSHVANPLVKISKNADKLITGEFNMTVSRGEYDEIKTLTENLNAASAEISKTENLRKDLMANVSHDLKTPLTMIKAYAEMIRDLSGNNPEKREKHLRVIIDETDRLTLLVNDILNLSKLESGVAEINRSVFDFSQLLRDIISRFSLLNGAKDYEVRLEAEEGIDINADQQKLEQVVYNLVNNAINYIGDDKLVAVRLYRKENGLARFEVSDHGPGIPKEQIPYIWERYYKVDRSENYKRVVKGTGLGLSIVKGVLNGHRFPFGCDSVVGSGSTFWFEFPVYKAPEMLPEKELLKP
ncbi:MAG: HAMP domain-containing histidine kinase [Bacteroides sp.]|nr:HAMP domain-containing histidine kinase [Bacteroides sp.]